MTPSPLHGRRRDLIAVPPVWLIFLVAFALQLPLALNPGYYSHDELQWGFFATHGQPIDWFDLSRFQYRPLTFSLWRLLSAALFQTPRAFHAVLVAWGAANAAGVHAIGRKLGIAPPAAAIGALVFALGPQAVMVHGWVGTIADLAWLTCALLAAAAALWWRWPAAIAAAAFAATAAGLLAKEAALSIPLLCLVAAVFDDRRARWLAAAAGSLVAAGTYVALRLDTLLHTANVPDLYVAKVTNVPVRWIEYQLFTGVARATEAHVTLTLGAKWFALGALLWLAFVAATWRASGRLALFLLAASGAALGPVLLLGSASNHYAYGFAVVFALCGAAAWARTPRWGRAAIATYALVAVLHGAIVMRSLVEVGRVQSVFSPALAGILRTRPLSAPVLRLRPDDAGKAWMFLRLTHDIPAYAGVRMGNRIAVVDAGDAADYRITPEGGLVPLR